MPSSVYSASGAWGVITFMVLGGSSLFHICDLLNPTASLDSTFSLPSLSMRETGAVITPLPPRDQHKGLRNRIGAEKQHDFQWHLQL
jgi:hypothetical protein